MKHDDSNQVIVAVARQERPVAELDQLIEVVDNVLPVLVKFSLNNAKTPSKSRE